MTLKELLRELDQRCITYAKIASGYYVGELGTVDPAFQYLLCKCGGNYELVRTTCACGTELTACRVCFESGKSITCPKCMSAINRNRRAFSRAVGMPWDEIEKELNAPKRRLETPIDFAQLVAEGKLERVSPTEYKLLVPLSKLPEHVQDQIVGLQQTEVNGKVVETIIEFGSH